MGGETFADIATLNEWFYERLQHGNSNFATNINNQAQVDSIIAKYGTRYVMFTGVETENRKIIQRPVLFALSCIVVVPVIRAFIPRNNSSYDVAVLDLKTGEVITVQHEVKLKGKEDANTKGFYSKIFSQLSKAKKPNADGKPVTEMERGM